MPADIASGLFLQANQPNVPNPPAIKAKAAGVGIGCYVREVVLGLDDVPAAGVSARSAKILTFGDITYS